MMSSAARRAPSHWYLGIDRRLPELPAAFDLPAVSRLYEERWPGGAQRGLRVRARKVREVDYQPSARCVVAHELTLKRGGDEPVGGGHPEPPHGIRVGAPSRRAMSGPLRGRLDAEDRGPALPEAGCERLGAGAPAARRGASVARAPLPHSCLSSSGPHDPSLRPGGTRPVGQTLMRRTPHITVGLGGRDDERFSLLRKGIYRAMPRESEPRLNIGYVVSTWPRLSQKLAVGSRAS